MLVVLSGIAFVTALLTFAGQQVANGANDLADQTVKGLDEVKHWLKTGPLHASDTQIERLIGIACLSPSVGLSEPWRFVIVEDEARRALIRQCFEACNKDALEMQTPDRAALYARLKLAGLDDATLEAELLQVTRRLFDLPT